ncbi:MAG TPA: tetratricopeptide repeat protein [Candidatus Omnitrophota bacterium]|nr:tetratricopeptide repeat protein [Candidatus Omnitrophota bacterium]
MKKIIFLTLIFCGLLASTAGAEISKEESISRFVQGNLSYKEGNYERAIEQYEAVLQGGKTSGFLYFNLANAYYRQGHLGKAILNYERAKRLIPRDSDLNFNYQYVRSKANLFEGQIGTSFWQQAIEQHVDFYSLEEMVYALTAALLAMGIIHLLSLYQRWPKRVKNFMVGSLSLVVLIFFAGLVIQLNREGSSAVVLSKSDAKFEPRQDSTTHYKLPEGVKVKVLKKDGAWVKVQRSDGKLGWMPQENIEEI